MIKRTTKNSGFSLIEVLVSISLLLVALVGPMTFFARSSQSAEVANDRVQATFLAQEGSELMQKIRDDAVLSQFPANPTAGWNSFLSQVSTCTSGCGLSLSDTGTVDIVPNCTGNSCLLYYHENGERSRFRYDASGGEGTPFTREVQITVVDAGREVRVVSEVSWQTTSLSEVQRVSVETALFNVYGN